MAPVRTGCTGGRAPTKSTVAPGSDYLDGGPGDDYLHSGYGCLDAGLSSDGRIDWITSVERPNECNGP